MSNRFCATRATNQAIYFDSRGIIIRLLFARKFFFHLFFICYQSDCWKSFCFQFSLCLIALIYLKTYSLIFYFAFVCVRKKQKKNYCVEWLFVMFLITSDLKFAFLQAHEPGLILWAHCRFQCDIYVRQWKCPDSHELWIRYSNSSKEKCHGCLDHRRTFYGVFDTDTEMRCRKSDWLGRFHESSSLVFATPDPSKWFKFKWISKLTRIIYTPAISVSNECSTAWA